MRTTMAWRWLGGMTIVLAVGCTSPQATSRPSSLSERADEALRDPFNYKPGHENHDISGGGLTDLDKDAMRKDMDHVFNP